MRPDMGRLQTAEHILAGMLEKDFNVRVGVCRFSGEYGTLEVMSENDMRKISLRKYQEEVQKEIDMDLHIRITELGREDAGSKVNLGRVPQSAETVRVVEIGDIDKRACMDSHVSNTREIGRFVLSKAKRAGRNRCRLTFTVD
jgi:misacylated tRNA(Ala) deacylase